MAYNGACRCISFDETRRTPAARSPSRAPAVAGQTQLAGRQWSAFRRSHPSGGHDARLGSPVPYSFEAVWNGGPDPDDIEISDPGFVVSEVGHGVLTFETGFQIELDIGHDLWVR